MNVVLGIATTCIWCIIMVVMPSLAIQESICNEQVYLGAYPTETFQLQNIDDYSNFLGRLRGRFESPIRTCGLPVTRDKLPNGGEYVLVDLKISTTDWVTVALKVTDLYLVAYRVNKKYKDGYHAVFLNEPDVKFAMANLFKDSKQITLSYDSNYANIERAANIKGRANLPLGFQELRKKIKGFYDATEQKPVSAVDEAKFLLIAIQMVAEATRFKYIEDKVVESGDFKTFKPDAHMIHLQTNWQKISDAFRKAELEKKCDTVENGKDVKLLKHKRNKLSAY